VAAGAERVGSSAPRTARAWSAAGSASAP
jgi:hypothetical protein